MWVTFHRFSLAITKQFGGFQKNRLKQKNDCPFFLFFSENHGTLETVYLSIPLKRYYSKMNIYTLFSSIKSISRIPNLDRIRPSLQNRVLSKFTVNYHISIGNVWGSRRKVNCTRNPYLDPFTYT